jgi:hypothetical protein
LKEITVVAMTRSSKLLAFVLLVLPSLASGADFDLRPRFPWGEGRDGKFDAPMKVLPFWSEAVLNQPDRPGTRGFGGRLLFYGKDQKKTVKVKGTLVVYAFDEEGRDPANVKPDRKYVYKPEDFEQTHAKNEVGHSYNIWLPWDEVGGPQKEISLIVRFTSEKGDLVVSEQQRQRLTGVPTDNQPAGVTLPQLAGTKAGVSTNVTLLPPGTNQAALPPLLQQAAFQQAVPQQNMPAATNSVMTNSGVVQTGGMQPMTGVLPMNGQQPVTQQTLAAQQAAAYAMVQTPTNPTGEKRMETTTIQLPAMTAARWNQQSTSQPMQTQPMQNMTPTQNPWINQMPAQNPWPIKNGATNSNPPMNGYPANGLPETGTTANGSTGQGLGLPATQPHSTNLMQGQAAAAPTLFGAHYVPGTHQAPTWQAGQPGLGPARWQPFPATQRFGQPSAPAQVQSP